MGVFDRRKVYQRRGQVMSRLIPYVGPCLSAKDWWLFTGGLYARARQASCEAICGARGSAKPCHESGKCVRDGVQWQLGGGDLGFLEGVRAPPR